MKPTPKSRHDVSGTPRAPHPWASGSSLPCRAPGKRHAHFSQHSGLPASGRRASGSGGRVRPRRGSVRAWMKRALQAHRPLVSLTTGLEFYTGFALRIPKPIPHDIFTPFSYLRSAAVSPPAGWTLWGRGCHGNRQFSSREDHCTPPSLPALGQLLPKSVKCLHKPCLPLEGVSPASILWTPAPGVTERLRAQPGSPP